MLVPSLRAGVPDQERSRGGGLRDKAGVPHNQSFYNCLMLGSSDWGRTTGEATDPERQEQRPSPKETEAPRQGEVGTARVAEWILGPPHLPREARGARARVLGERTGRESWSDSRRFCFHLDPRVSGGLDSAE